MLWIKRSYKQRFVFFTFLLFGLQARSQCPPNMGFEDSSFNYWECFSGKVDNSGIVNVAAVGPIPNNHTILKNTYPQLRDNYGDFPVNCPNGSNYSIKLGNDEVNSGADRVSYTFTIPVGQNVYSIIYNYAVVLQNPAHTAAQQPRFTAKVFDSSSGQYIDCSSFDYSASSSLPGFKQSSVKPDVYYKPWSPVTIKLLGYGGKTIRLEFTAHDCTLGAHFGYAYLDINEDCTSPIKGNVYCIGAKSVTLTAPFGFMEYHWYNAGFTALLGSQNTLRFNPPPPSGTVYALEVIPYPGSGCVDTLYTTITYAQVPFDLRVSDSVGVCSPLYADLTLPAIKAGSSPGLTYAYFIDSALTAYVPTPSIIANSGTYYIKATNSAGCMEAKPVKVVISDPPNITVTEPLAVIYPNKVDITAPSIVTNSILTTHLTYTYWQNAGATISLSNPDAVGLAGTYFIKAANPFGCFVTRSVTVTIKPSPPPNIFSPNGDGINDLWLINGIQAYPQCKMDVYSRYGELVFHSVGYYTPWDGKFNGKPLPAGTYYYVLQLSPQVNPASGSITIIR